MVVATVPSNSPFALDPSATGVLARAVTHGDNEGGTTWHGDSYLLSFPFCNAAYRSVVLSQTYVFLLAMLPPGYTLLFKKEKKSVLKF